MEGKRGELVSGVRAIPLGFEGNSGAVVNLGPARDRAGARGGWRVEFLGVDARGVSGGRGEQGRGGCDGASFGARHGGTDVTR